MLKKFIDYLIIKRNKAFDPAYYLLQYPDCRLADIDPLWHFVQYGWKEGRNPSSSFDTEYYLRTNPDVRLSGMNPLVHFLRYGREEGRAPQPSSNVSGLLYKRPPANSRRAGLQKVLYSLGIKAYEFIPPQYRQSIVHWFYSHFGFVFRGMPDYEIWRGNQYFSRKLIPGTNLIDLQTVKPAREAGGSVAIHLHIFYYDLAREFAEYLKNMPFPYDLYISVTEEDAVETCRRTFANLPLCRKFDIRKVPNRGRDIAPMFCAFGKELSGYDYIAHLHTKKSLYNRGATEGWREYLCRTLLGSQGQIQRIFGLMQEQATCGIVYPQNYTLLPYWANTWLADRHLGRIWGARLGITDIPRGYFDYPASSMFWARTEALAPLFRAGITLDDFPEESGQTDGTLAHTLERLFVLCALNQGMYPGIIRDEKNPSWSAWRFDQYANRPYTALVDALCSSQIRLIGFDIFDTLLSRPLLNPETVKALVARRVGGEAGSLYRQYRAIAEQQARQAKGIDVRLDEIYAQLKKLTRLSEANLEELRNREEEVEEALLEPRWQVLQLYQEAVATGKPVVLITDMFLSRDRIEKYLHKYEIEGWERLFVSSDIGLRKDEGKLYELVLSQYGVKPTGFLMIGDNERSDTQIPCDMGAAFIHLLRPVELARGLPKFSPLIATCESNGDVDAELTLGLVVRKNFSSIHYPAFDPASLVPMVPYNIGYSLVGPLLVSFSNWLIQQSQADGIERLYFLSREGKIMQEVYTCWSEGLTTAPVSDYLVISRRAAGVAAISTFDDILTIAKTIYFPNTIENFLRTRYGLVLSEARWHEITEQTGWTRTTQVSVQNGKIAPLLPILRALAADIFASAQREHEALMWYLTMKGLNQDDKQAVVDVGYGGSVQGYLNRLLSRKVHGYYLMTDDRSPNVAQTYKVTLRGCFYENVTQSPHAPVMYRYSFEVEKMLSSTEPQVEYYELAANNALKGVYRALQPLEQAATEIKKGIRQGALDYAADARQIRQIVLPDFKPSLETAQRLMEAFLDQRSPQEVEWLSQIVLDDHYCGRGLVL